MQQYQPLNVLPSDIQRDWLAQLHQATPTSKGVLRLVAIRRTAPKSFEEQRVVVLVVDENGFPLPNVPVAFAYTTANFYELAPNFLWTPPSPQRAFIVPTQGGGQIDQIQGSGVNSGQAGGITVYILTPEYSSDVVTGAGMLADHTGLHLTFQLRRNGVRPIMERMEELEARMDATEALKNRLTALESRIASAKG